MNSLILVVITPLSLISFNFSSTVQIDADYIDLTGNSFVYADCTTTGYCLWLPGSYDNTGCDICEA